MSIQQLQPGRAAATAPAIRAAIYVRISLDRVGRGLGVGRQQADCEALAERLGATVVRVFIDNDLSAYSGKPRPAYRELLAAVGRGEFDVVLVWHTDRLHRSPLELEEWITACDPHSVAVHGVKAGELDLATSSGRAVARTLGAWARYESEHASERINAKMDDKAAKGEFLGGYRPFGYTADGMQIEPAEAALIVWATEQILQGASLRSVTRAFRESEFAPTRAKEWSTHTVKGVLLRERNAGLMLHRGVVVGKAAWPAIISKEEHHALVSLLDNPTRRCAPIGAPRRWLGSGLYLCGVCGGTMQVGTAGKNRKPKYVCGSYTRQTKGGRHVSRTAEHLDAFILEHLIGWLSQPDAAQVFATPAVPAGQLNTWRTELGVIEAQRGELGARLGRGEITMAMLDAANVGLTARAGELEAKLASAMSSSPVSALVGVPDVAAVWAQMDLEAQRGVLAELMTVTVHPAPHGRMKDGSYFHGESVGIAWRHDAGSPTPVG